jgi:hypothetical protein
MMYLFCYTAFLTAWTGIIYKDYAMRKCWPIGTWFLNDKSLPNMGSFSLAILVFIFSFFYITWYMVFVLSFAGFITAFIIMEIFKSYTQYLWILLFIATNVLFAITPR